MKGAILRLALLAAAAAVLAGCDAASSDDWDEEEPDPVGDLVGDLVEVGVVAAIHGVHDGWESLHPDRGPGPAGARADLVRDGGSADPDDRGQVRVRASRRGWEFRVTVDGLDAGQRVDVLVTDAMGVPVPVGSAASPDGGRAVLDVLSRRGEAVPGGYPSFGYLEGRAVEVRDPAGATLLRGHVPPADRTPRRYRTRAVCRDAADGPTASILLAGDAWAQRHFARLAFRDLPAGTAVELLVEDAEGVFRAAGTATADGLGLAQVLFDSRRGDPLPAGAPSLFHLQGRAFEVRIDGAVEVSGEFPVF